MVESKNCNFCGKAIEPGTGKIYVKKDGTIYHHCTNKCKKNQIDLGRVPRRTRWTKRYAELKESALKHEVKEEAPKPKKKVKEEDAQKPKKRKARTKKEEPDEEKPGDEGE